MDVRVGLKEEHRRIDAFELWCWRRLLRVSWTVRRSNQPILKEISSYGEVKLGLSLLFSSVHLFTHVWLLPTRRAAACQASPSHHQFPELAQTHVRWVSDAIQPSLPLSSPSPPAFNLFQHQGLFQWVSSSHQVAKVLGFQLQHQSFQWIFRTDFL